MQAIFSCSASKSDKAAAMAMLRGSARQLYTLQPQGHCSVKEILRSHSLSTEPKVPCLGTGGRQIIELFRISKLNLAMII